MSRLTELYNEIPILKAIATGRITTLTGPNDILLFVKEIDDLGVDLKTIEKSIVEMIKNFYSPKHLRNLLDTLAIKQEFDSNLQHPCCFDKHVRTKAELHYF